MKKQELKAVHKQNLRKLLENWGLIDDFEAKKIKCDFCDEIVSENNMGALFSKDKKIFFVCPKIECLNKLSYK